VLNGHIHQGKVVAHNIAATIRDQPKKPFAFSSIGQLAAIGRRTGVARILGVNFSGFLAWWLWRTIYLCKLPRFEKKLRVALDWTLDLFFSKDLVQFHHAPLDSIMDGHGIGRRPSPGSHGGSSPDQCLNETGMAAWSFSPPPTYERNSRCHTEHPSEGSSWSSGCWSCPPGRWNAGFP
jgi:hypothetical protein